MGTSRNVAEFANTIGVKYPREIERANRLAVAEAAKLTTAVVNARVARATGGDMVLSGMGRTAKGRARGRIRAAAKIRNGEAFVYMQGAAPLVENDVEPHYVFPKGARAGGRRGRVKSYADRTGKRRSFNIASAYAGAVGPESVNVGPHRLKFGGNYVPWVLASSKGRHPWRDGTKEADPLVRRTFKAAHARALGKTFR